MTERRTPDGGALYAVNGDGQAEAPPPPPDFPSWLPDINIGDAETPALTAHPARLHWDRLAPLCAPGTLTEATAPTFAMLCVAMATYAEADEILQAAGLLIPGEGNYLMENPALKVRDRADAQISKWAKMFGLSPDGRPRALPAPQGKNEPARHGLPHLYES